MENASKALLIAGAILVVIIIIGLGMMILNSSTGILQSATTTMSTKEKDLFNQQFTIYEGTQNGSTIKGLLSAVISSNNNSSNQEVLVNGNKPNTTSNYDGQTSSTGKGIISAKNYKVTIESYKDGLVEKIKIDVVQ